MHYEYTYIITNAFQMRFDVISNMIGDRGDRKYSKRNIQKSPDVIVSF